MILNAGNIIDRNVPFNDIASKYIMKILALSGVEVLGVGPQELTLGQDKLKALIEQSPINVVSANLPGILPYVRLKKNGCKTRVLVTSVIDPEVLKTYKIEFESEIEDPIKALKRLQKEIEHDLFIVIVHAMGERVSAIINSCPGIDIAVDGLTATLRDDLGSTASTPLLCNNRRGQYVTYVDYQKSGERKITKPALMRAGVGFVAEDPEIKKIAEAYNIEKIAFSKLARKKKLRERMQLQMQKNPPNLYLGNRACESCHFMSAEKWRESRHAKAFASLVKRERQDDIECVKCHVTGMGDKHAVGGFTSFDENPWMVNVQCEACHGPGANHAQNPLAHKLEKVEERRCLTCHTEVTDPDFKLHEKLLLIEHSEKR